MCVWTGVGSHLRANWKLAEVEVETFLGLSDGLLPAETHTHPGSVLLHTHTSWISCTAHTHTHPGSVLLHTHAHKTYTYHDNQRAV